MRLQSPDASEHVRQERYLPGRFKDIFAREGVRGLYRGAGPTTLRGALVAGAQGGGWIDIDLILLLPCRFWGNLGPCLLLRQSIIERLRI